ncbi:MAG: NAD-dependent epimerase/dehydratase family protein [Candidatus Staskawiczbacteria bacterium]|nr:NAD-dependent epimerase/dehydratase family protein [Candidatus Staskawiczbacteria bacterium]
MNNKIENPIIEQDLKLITNADIPWGKLEGKNILISGANGFLPSYLVKTILFLNENKFKNKAKVFAMDMADNRLAIHKGRKDLVFINQDICQPIDIKDDIHFIIHAASKASPKFFGKDPVGTLSANIFGTKNLLDFAKEKKVDSFLFFSSGEIYGQVSEKDMPIKENTYGRVDTTNVRSCYAESKRMGETMCVSWLYQYNVPAKIVRPFHTYGPGMNLDDGRVFADFVSDVVNNRNIIMKSAGNAVRPFCYIADATIGFFTILLKGENGQAYNLGNDLAEISVFNLAKLLVELFPEKNLKVEKKENNEVGYLKSGIDRCSPNVSKIRQLGWSPRYDLKQGFMRTVESFNK